MILNNGNIVVDVHTWSTDGVDTDIMFLNKKSPLIGYEATPSMLKALVEVAGAYVYDHDTGERINETNIGSYIGEEHVGYGNGIVSQLLPGSNGCPVYLSKDGEMHYLIDYGWIDYRNAYDYFLKNYYKNNQNDAVSFVGGGCSVVSDGQFIGRNYDWYYDHHAVFTIHTDASNGKHEVFGNVATVPGLTEEFVQSRKYSESYKLLPFFLLDGFNDAGLFCEMNILIGGQTVNGHVADTSEGTTPTEELRDKVCTLMLIRYILDNFSSVQDVIENLPKYTSVYSASNPKVSGEFHLMLKDSVDVYVLEFIPNAETGLMEMVFINSADDPIMTNFYKYNSRRDVDGHIDYTSLTRYAEGIERYNIAADALADEVINSIGDMNHIMYDLMKYTQAYTIDDINDAWLSEFVGVTKIGETIYDITTDDVVNDKSKVEPLYRYCQSLYENRTRDVSNTWQTVHCAVYDLENGVMCLTVQENGTPKMYKYKAPWHYEV